MPLLGVKTGALDAAVIQFPQDSSCPEVSLKGSTGAVGRLTEVDGKKAIRLDLNGEEYYSLCVRDPIFSHFLTSTHLD